MEIDSIKIEIKMYDYRVGNEEENKKNVMDLLDQIKEEIMLGQENSKSIGGWTYFEGTANGEWRIILPIQEQRLSFDECASIPDDAKEGDQIIVHIISSHKSWLYEIRKGKPTKEENDNNLPCGYYNVWRHAPHIGSCLNHRSDLNLKLICLKKY